MAVFGILVLSIISSSVIGQGFNGTELTVGNETISLISALTKSAEITDPTTAIHSTAAIHSTTKETIKEAETTPAGSTITPIASTTQPPVIKIDGGCFITFQADPREGNPVDAEFTLEAETAEICAIRCYQDGCTGAYFFAHNSTCHLGYEGKHVCTNSKEVSKYRPPSPPHAALWIHCVTCRPAVNRRTGEFGDSPAERAAFNHGPAATIKTTEATTLKTEARTPEVITTKAIETTKAPETTRIVSETTKPVVETTKLAVEATEATKAVETTITTLADTTKIIETTTPTTEVPKPTETTTISTSTTTEATTTTVTSETKHATLISSTKKTPTITPQSDIKIENDTTTTLVPKTETTKVESEAKTESPKVETSIKTETPVLATEATTTPPVFKSVNETEAHTTKTAEPESQLVLNTSVNKPLIKVDHGCFITFQADVPAENNSATHLSAFELSLEAETPEICAIRCYQDGCTGALFIAANSTCLLGYEGKHVCTNAKEVSKYRGPVLPALWIHCASCRPEVNRHTGEAEDKHSLKPEAKPQNQQQPFQKSS